MDMLLREQRQEGIEPVVMYLLDKRGQALAYCRQLLFRRQTIWTRSGYVGGKLVFEASYTNHDKFVEIRVEDRKKLHPLQ